MKKRIGTMLDEELIFKAKQAALTDYRHQLTGMESVSVFYSIGVKFVISFI